MDSETRKLLASVIIPCMNDAQHLPKVLAALDAQTLPRKQFEVLVIDNGSTDNSFEIAKDWPEVVALSEPVPSAYIARNRGIAHARGEYLLFLDADTIPCPVWLESMLKAARSSDLGLAGGRIESRVKTPTLGSRLLAWSRNAETRKAAVVERGRLSGGNMLVAKKLFDKYGLFLTVKSSGDCEFAERANPQRKPVPFADDAVVEHICDISTMDYLRRAYRVARGQAECSERRLRPLPIPWRPGFGRVNDVAEALSAATTGPSIRSIEKVKLWGVLWLEGWFQFAGKWVGTSRKLKVESKR